LRRETAGSGFGKVLVIRPSGRLYIVDVSLRQAAVGLGEGH